MKKRPERFLLLLGMAILLFSCRQGEKFEVRGNIASADGEMLYLEHRGLGGVRLLDSTQLDQSGAFAFKQPAPDNPEFYQLRMGDRIALFAVDSTERLQIHADAADWYDSFEVENSPANDRLKEVERLTRTATRGIDALEEGHRSGTIDDREFIEQLDTILRQYKREVSQRILANPTSAAAYYAIFQKIEEQLIFDPYNRQDYAMYGAVATAWSRYYPDTERSNHLVEFTMNALKTRRREEKQMKFLESIPMEEATGVPDILLPEVNGRKVALSSLRGKVVLLDFVVYDADFSPKHNMELNSLYDRYRLKGFEIYQVSFDSDEHFWKIAADNLPWLTVRDPRSVYSSLPSTYNVTQIPTAFLINREGDIISRIEEYGRLGEELKKVL